MNKDASQTKRNRGFKRAANLMGERINAVSQQRGFAVSRLLTHWAEIAGPDIASMSRPVEMSYGKGGFGATLCLLTTGANAPVLEMQKAKLREKVKSRFSFLLSSITWIMMLSLNLKFSRSNILKPASPCPNAPSQISRSSNPARRRGCSPPPR